MPKSINFSINWCTFSMGRRKKLSSDISDKHFKKTYLLNNIKMRKSERNIRKTCTNEVIFNDTIVREDNLQTLHFETRNEACIKCVSENLTDIHESSQLNNTQFEDSILTTSEQSIHKGHNETPIYTSKNCTKEEFSIKISDKKVTDYIMKGLRIIAIKKNLPRSAVTSILKLLNPVFPNIPTDYRKLLLTPRITKIKKVTPGRYVHFGLRKGIAFKIMQLKLSIDKIKLDCFVDGVALHPSSKNKTFWIILTKINGVSNSIIPVGLYNGRRKPDDFDNFLKTFIMELKNVLTTGVEVNGRKIDVEVQNICLDTPARSSVCGTIGHMGYKSCIRCLCFGIYKERRMLFKYCECEKRTDDMFRNREDLRYHNRNSLIEKELNLKMLTQFPLDFLHVVLLGPGRKFFKKLVGITKPMFPHSRTAVDTLFTNINETSPAEIHRTFRSLNDISSFKGHEWRLILLKLAPVLLKNNIPRVYYEHYLLLTCAFTILCDPEKCIKYNRIAHAMLIKFNKQIKNLYNDLMYVPMVHQTMHFADEVLIQQQPCDRFSTWEFESFMTPIKKFIHGPKLPLSQIYRRITEYFNCPDVIDTQTEKNIKGKGYLFYQGFRFDTTNCRDRYFLTKDKQVIVVLKIIRFETPQFLCRKLKIIDDYFLEPLVASKLNFFHAQSAYIDQKFIIDISQIERKLFCIITEENNLFLAPFNPLV